MAWPVLPPSWKKIWFIYLVLVQILGNLPFLSFIVFAAMPDFQLDDKLFQIIHYDIRAPLIPCLRLDIVIPCAVNNRFQIYQENPASLLFNKFLVPLSVMSVI